MDNPPEITPEMLQANPGLMLALGAFSIFLLVFFVGTVLSWGFCGTRLYAGKPLLSTLPWLPRRWGLSELLVAILAMFFFQVLLVQLAVPLLGIDPETLGEEGMPLSLAAVSGLGSLLTVLATCLFIFFRFGSSPEHMGFKGSGILKQVATGLIAGLAVIPVTMMLSAAVTLTSQQEYEHPILDGMADEGTFLSFLFAGFAAVIVAPFAEEFLFRVLLQGWLQSIPFRDLWTNIVGGESRSSLAVAHGGLVATELESDLVSDSPYAQSPYSPPPDEAPVSDSSEAGEGFVPPIWPSILSGVLFGLAHWGYGLSFIPLIFLGIVLGLIYRATQSIWPCVIVHFLLNFTSIAALGISVYVQQVAGTAP